MTEPKMHRWTLAAGMGELHAMRTDGTGLALCGLRHSSWLERLPAPQRSYLKCTECIVSTRNGKPNQLPPHTRPAGLHPLENDQRELLERMRDTAGVGGLRMAYAESGLREWALRFRLAVANVTEGTVARLAISQRGIKALHDQFYPHVERY